MQFEPTDCFAVIGRRGHGKSYLGKTIQKAFPRRIVFDTVHEYNSGTIVHSFDEFTSAIRQNEHSPNYEIIFQMDVDIENKVMYFNEALRILYFLGNCLIVIEELQEYCTPHALPHYLRECILLGRHRNIGLIFTSQRPGQINKTILSQCNHVFVGSIHETNDLKYIAGFIHEENEVLSGLKPRTFLYYRPGMPISLIGPVKNSLELNNNSPDNSITKTKTPSSVDHPSEVKTEES